jgi:sirohydrochlorin ferrochelatase
MGAHVQEDLPEEVAMAKLRYPHIEFALGKHLGVHRKLAEVVVERIEECQLQTGWH